MSLWACGYLGAVLASTAAVGGPPPAAPGAAGEVDYSQAEPPPHRSWHAEDPLGEGREGGGPAPEAAVAREEGVLLRALARMLLVLVGVVAAMLVLARLARGMRAKLPGWVGAAPGPRPGPGLCLVERLALGPKHSLAWVESAEGAAFLVAFGEGGTSLLGPITQSSRPSFAATMAKVTHEHTPRDPPAARADAPAPGDGATPTPTPPRGSATSAQLAAS